MKGSRLCTTVAGAAVLAALVTGAHAQDPDVPMLLNYQGSLQDTGSGAALSGTFSMTFQVFDAASGGNALPSTSPWSETQDVTVTDGTFHVLLGSATDLPADLFEGGPTDAKGPLRFLEVAVCGPSGSATCPDDAETLSPRRRIGSAAYAIHSSTTAVGSPAGASRSVPNGSHTIYATPLDGDGVFVATQVCTGGNVSVLAGLETFLRASDVGCVEFDPGLPLAAGTDIVCSNGDPSNNLCSIVGVVSTLGNVQALQVRDAILARGAASGASRSVPSGSHTIFTTPLAGDGSFIATQVCTSGNVSVLAGQETFLRASDIGCVSFNPGIPLAADTDVVCNNGDPSNNLCSIIGMVAAP